jgi:hypothetical protein
LRQLAQRRRHDVGIAAWSSGSSISTSPSIARAWARMNCSSRGVRAGHDQRRLSKDRISQKVL